MQIKLEFPTDCDAQHGAYYLQDRGYSVKLMGKALVAEAITRMTQLAIQ